MSFVFWIEFCSIDYCVRGVLGIVWFGYDDEEIRPWKQREESLLTVLRKPLGKYVIHSVSFGSEPLFSWSISDTFVPEMLSLKAQLKQIGVPLTVSEVSEFMKFALYISNKIDEIRLRCCACRNTRSSYKKY